MSDSTSSSQSSVGAPRIVQAARLVSTPRRVGDYAVERRLGKGGMSEVHLAHDPDGNRVAIKHVPAGGDPSHRSRLRREARTTARLDHPTSVKILDVVEDDDGLWLVLEFVDGITLAEEIGGGRLPAIRALDIAAQITAGLASAHKIGILHRDLKSENVMLTPDGRVRLLDFGLAKALWSEDESQTLTLHGEVMGTCRAMSPEQARGWKLDGRSDFFALGSLIYEMVTGISPFQAKTPVATMNKVCTHQPPAAHLVENDVPRSVSQLIARLHQKKADDRPHEAQEVADLIASTREQIGRGPDRKWPSAPALWAAVLLAILLAAGWLFQALDEAPPEPATQSSSAPRANAQRDGSSTQEASPSDPLKRSLEEATSAADLANIRRQSLLMLKRHGLPSWNWADAPPPVFLAETCSILAAIDFELAAPDAAARWLELSQEILNAQSESAKWRAGRVARHEKKRQQILDWPADSSVVGTIGPLRGCETWAEISGSVAISTDQDIDHCAPLSRFADDLEKARLEAEPERLQALAEAAAERGLRRFELRARLEYIRALGATQRASEAAARLEDEAALGGLNALTRRLRALHPADDPENPP